MPCDQEIHACERMWPAYETYQDVLEEKKVEAGINRLRVLFIKHRESNEVFMIYVIGECENCSYDFLFLFFYFYNFLLVSLKRVILLT